MIEWGEYIERLTGQLGAPHLELCLRCVRLHWHPSRSGFRLRTPTGLAVRGSDCLMAEREAYFPRVEFLARCREEEESESIFAHPGETDLVQ